MTRLFESWFDWSRDQFERLNYLYCIFDKFRLHVCWRRIIFAFVWELIMQLMLNSRFWFYFLVTLLQKKFHESIVFVQNFQQSLNKKVFIEFLFSNFRSRIVNVLLLNNNVWILCTNVVKYYFWRFLCDLLNCIKYVLHIATSNVWKSEDFLQFRWKMIMIRRQWT